MSRFLFVASVAATLALPDQVAAQAVYFTTESVLRSFFPASERVTYETVRPSDARSQLEGALGYLPPKASYVVYVALTGETIDGYAVIDEQVGQHLPITLATKISAVGAVERSEVMVYREAHGAGITSPRFREQLKGKTVTDPLTVGDDIAAVSGATISSRAMALAVKRAVALVEVVRTRRASSKPSSRGH